MIILQLVHTLIGHDVDISSGIPRFNFIKKMLISFATTAVVKLIFLETTFKFDFN